MISFVKTSKRLGYKKLLIDTMILWCPYRPTDISELQWSSVVVVKIFALKCYLRAKFLGNSMFSFYDVRILHPVLK